MSPIDLSKVQNPVILSNDLAIIFGVATVSLTLMQVAVRIYLARHKNNNQAQSNANDTELTSFINRPQSADRSNHSPSLDAPIASVDPAIDGASSNAESNDADMDQEG